MGGLTHTQSKDDVTLTLFTLTCSLPSLDLDIFGWDTTRTARRGRCKGTGEAFEIGQLRVGFEAGEMDPTM